MEVYTIFYFTFLPINGQPLTDINDRQRWWYNNVLLTRRKEKII